jgi:hypothetical protein
MTAEQLLSHDQVFAAISSCRHLPLPDSLVWFALLFPNAPHRLLSCVVLCANASAFLNTTIIVIITARLSQAEHWEFAGTVVFENARMLLRKRLKITHKLQISLAPTGRRIRDESTQPRNRFWPLLQCPLQSGNHS